MAKNVVLKDIDGNVLNVSKQVVELDLTDYDNENSDITKNFSSEELNNKYHIIKILNSNNDFVNADSITFNFGNKITNATIIFIIPYTDSLEKNLKDFNFNMQNRGIVITGYMFEKDNLKSASGMFNDMEEFSFSLRLEYGHIIKIDFDENGFAEVKIDMCAEV